MAEPAGWVELGSSADCVPAARRLLRDRLHGSGIGAERCDIVLLLASELVTNALLHSVGGVSLRLLVDRSAASARVEVHDDDPRLPIPRAHDAESVSGRGLELVEALASSYGVDVVPGGGKLVWFTVGRPRTADVGWRVAPVRPDDDLVATLPNLPVLLFQVMSEHNEALLREYGMYRLDHRDHPGLAPGQVSAADRARFSVATAIHAEIAANAMRPAPATNVDVTVHVQADDLPGLSVLQRVFDEAEELAGHGQLLTPAALPEIKNLRRWCTQELARQHAGLPGRQWQLDGSRSLDPALPLEPLPVELHWVEHARGAVVVADEGGRIACASPGVHRLLGWDPAALIGCAVSVLVPERLRESHIAGFSRQVLNGRGHILNRRVGVPALCADGGSRDVAMLLTSHPAGRTRYFIAHLDPVDPVDPAATVRRPRPTPRRRR